MEKKVIGKQNQGRNCFVCGVNNESGLHGQFFALEDGSLVGLFRPKFHHQSYPGRVHGGIITAMLDETIGRAVQVKDPDVWGVTAELTTRYLKPVPYDVDLRAGRHVVDAKSILGIFSLDLSKPIVMEVYTDSCDDLMEDIKPFMA